MGQDCRLRICGFRIAFEKSIVKADVMVLAEGSIPLDVRTNQKDTTGVWIKIYHLCMDSN